MVRGGEAGADWSGLIYCSRSERSEGGRLGQEECCGGAGETRFSDRGREETGRRALLLEQGAHVARSDRITGRTSVHAAASQVAEIRHTLPTPSLIKRASTKKERETGKGWGKGKRKMDRKQKQKGVHRCAAALIPALCTSPYTSTILVGLAVRWVA